MLKAELITEEQLRDGLETSQRLGRALSVVLNQLYSISSADLFDELAKAIELPRHETLRVRADPQALDLIDRSWAIRNRIIPISFSNNGQELRIALCDPTDTGAIEHLRNKISGQFKAELASDDEISLLLQTIYGHQADAMPTPVARLPTGAFIQPDAGIAHSMVVQDMDEMRNQLHQKKSTEAGSRSALDRAVSLRRGSTPIPLPIDALKPLADGNQPQNQAAQLRNPEPWLRLIQVNENASRVLEAVFELCVQRGIFTKEEYLTRLRKRD